MSQDPYINQYRLTDKEFFRSIQDIGYPQKTQEIDYKYNEDEYLEEIADYIDKTYGEHYAQGNIQSTEIAIDRGRGLGFCLGNVDKYSGRYGQKGSTDDWRKDLMKVIHYAIIALYVHDLEHKR